MNPQEIEQTVRNVFAEGNYLPAPNYFITDDHVGMCLFGALGYATLPENTPYNSQDITEAAIKVQLDLADTYDWLELVHGWNDTFYGIDTQSDSADLESYILGQYLAKKMIVEFGSYLYDDGSLKEGFKEGIGFR